MCFADSETWLNHLLHMARSCERYNLHAPHFPCPTIHIDVYYQTIRLDVRIVWWYTSPFSITAWKSFSRRAFSSPFADKNAPLDAATIGAYCSSGLPGQTEASSNVVISLFKGGPRINGMLESGVWAIWCSSFP